MIVSIENTDNLKGISWRVKSKDSSIFVLTSIVVALGEKPEHYCLDNQLYIRLNRKQIVTVIDDVKQYEPESTSFLREIRELLY